MNHRVTTSLSQEHHQKLIFTQSIGLALEFLQAPLDELEQSLYKQAEKNPFIEFHGFTVKSRNVPLSFDPPAPQSIYENLYSQVAQNFTHQERNFAYHILESLDERGYLKTPVGSLALQMNFSLPYAEKLLQRFQQLSPLGIGSRNLQEYLLIQLEDQKKQGTLSYRLLRDYFDDLLHQRFTLLGRKLHLSPEQIKRDLHENVKPLYIHPLSQQVPPSTYHVKPEVILCGNEELLEDPLESLSFNSSYKELVKTTSDKEQKALLQRLEKEALIIFSILRRRRRTIQRVVTYLKEKQKEFLFSSGELNSISIKEAALDLGVHESTLSRALHNKHLECDRGIFPLRYFFSKSFVGNLSKKRVADEITKLVSKENKHTPYSDEELMDLLKEKGFLLSRRSVAKLRNELKIPSKRIRRDFH